MIKIIEEGQATFTIRCKKCRCLFEYGLDNLNGFDLVGCPYCGNLCCHNDNIDFNYTPQTMPYTTTAYSTNANEEVNGFDLEIMMDDPNDEIKFIN